MAARPAKKTARCQNGAHKHDVVDCTAPRCWEKGSVACAFPLQGRRAGQACGRRICALHSIPWSGGDICPAHGRLVEQRKSQGGA